MMFECLQDSNRPMSSVIRSVQKSSLFTETERWTDQNRMLAQPLLMNSLYVLPTVQLISTYSPSLALYVVFSLSLL